MMCQVRWFSYTRVEKWDANSFHSGKSYTLTFRLFLEIGVTVGYQNIMSSDNKSEIE